MNSERIELLKDKLKIKQKELEDYVLNINNDYLSEEAEQMRAEIYDLQDNINKMENNYNSLEEDIKILEEHLNFIKNFDNGSEYIPALENLIKEFKKIKIENIEYMLGQIPDTTEDYKTLKKELKIWKKI